MSAQTQQQRVRARDIFARKNGDPIVCLTAYDAPTARLLDPHCDLLLVGDSVGNVVHGMETTVGVTVDMMILHGQAVMRGSARAMVVVDMPFGSYEESPEAAFRNAARIMSETGCQAVKLEAGPYAGETIRFLTGRGIPVMSHVGLRPQAVNVTGFKAQGRESAQREEIMKAAKVSEEGGAFSMVIEGVAESLAEEITAAVSVPTIGIGASNKCDGQILVTPDMLGVFEWSPKFVKHYESLGERISRAAAEYAAEVRSRAFPGPEHVYKLKS